MLKVGSRVWYNDPVIGGIYYICKIQPSNPLDKTSELVYSIGDSPSSGYIRAYYCQLELIGDYYNEAFED